MRYEARGYCSIYYQLSVCEVSKLDQQIFGERLIFIGSEYWESHYQMHRRYRETDKPLIVRREATVDFCG